MRSDPEIAFPGAGIGNAEVSASSAGHDGENLETTARSLEFAARAHELGREAARARSAGEEFVATRLFNQAVATGLEALQPLTGALPQLQLAVAQWALECGDVGTARTLAATRTVPTVEALRGGWAGIVKVDSWPEAWLVAAVRQSAPDEAALDELAQRHWKALFGRCQMLTLRREEAADLAQDTWCRVLRSRERLRPGGNFRAYLLMIATNLWRDSKRAALRAGTLAASRMTRLDSEIPLNGEGQTMTLAEILPDLEQLEAGERERLKHEVDHALSRLEVLWRDVLVARFLDGESCAEIARRYGRTEQTASNWVRRAVAELRLFLESTRRGVH